MKRKITWLFVLFGHLAFAQYEVELVSTEMYIDGTSSLHDWTEIVEEVYGKMDATTDKDKLLSIDKLQFNIPVISIKSGKSGMDRNTYAAMKSKKYPEITFEMRDFTLSTHGTGKMKGNLFIAGVTNTVDGVVTYKVYGNTLELHGMYDLKMTDYDIDPPTAMMGTIVTDDELKIRFKLVFKNNTAYKYYE